MQKSLWHSHVLDKQKMVQVFKLYKNYRSVKKAVYPLFTLKWCPKADKVCSWLRKGQDMLG